jgi:hypothetical protein
MTWRLHTSRVSKSGPHPVDGLNQPHHTLATTTDQIPAITSISGSAQHLRARKRDAGGISAVPSYHPYYDESAKHVYGGGKVDYDYDDGKRFAEYEKRAATHAICAARIRGVRGTTDHEQLLAEYITNRAQEDGQYWSACAWGRRWRWREMSRMMTKTRKRSRHVVSVRVGRSGEGEWSYDLDLFPYCSSGAQHSFYHRLSGFYPTSRKSAW